MPIISKIKLPNDSQTYDLTDGRGMFVGACSSSAASQTKEVSVSVDQNFVLRAGAVVAVKFANTNTYNATASAPCKLNINGTGAKNIYYAGSATPTGTNTTAFGTANYYHYYIYDGTYWVWNGYNNEANTTYSKITDAEITAGTSDTTRLITALKLKNGVQTWETPTDQIPVKNSINSASSGYTYNMSKSLIKQINEGSKNMMPVASGTAPSTSSWFQTNELNLPAGTYVISFESLTSTDSDATTCRGIFYDSADASHNVSNYFQIPRGNNVHIVVTLTGTAKALRINQSDTVAHSSGDTMTFTGAMICTEEDYALSSTFTEYCPSLQELYNGRVIPVKTSSAISDLNEAYEVGLYFYQNTALNKPTSSGGVVLTLQNQTNGRAYSKQIAFVNSNAFSATNFPIYARESNSSGVFSDWVQFSPLASN